MDRTVISFLVTAGFFTAAGAAVLRLLGLPFRWWRAWMLGCGSVGAILYVIGTCRVPLTPVTTLLLLAGLMLAAIRSRHRTERQPDAGNPVTRWAVAAALVASVPVVVACVDAATLPTRDYDGRTFWLPKALAISQEHSITGPFFRGENIRNLHNRYPLLVPLDASVVLQLTRDQDAETGTRWLYLLFGVAFLMMLADLCGARGIAPGWWCAAAAAWLPPFFAGMTGSSCDLPLAAFAGAAAADLDAIHRDAARPRTFALYVSFLILTKNEGVVIALALCALALLRWRTRWLALPVSAVAVLFVWRASVPNAYDENYAALVRIPELARVITAVGELVAHAAAPAQWGALWVAAAIAMIVRRSAVAALIGMTFAAYVYVYSITSWNIGELARVSADRLLLHQVAPAMMLIAALSVPRERRAGI